MSSTIGGALSLVGVVGLVIGVLMGFGIVPLAVTCTQNCTAGVSPSFTVTETGYQANVTDSSHWAGTATGTIDKITVNWGDGTSTSAATGIPTNKLPFTGQSFVHSYAQSGTYAISESLSHHLCGGGKGGVHCSDTVVTSQGEFAFAGCSSCSNVYYAHFKYTVGNAFSVSVTDSSYSVGSPNLTSINFKWGDGVQAVPTTIGFTLTHTYPNAGNFTAVETLKWTYAGDSYTTPYTVVIQSYKVGASNDVTVSPYLSVAATGFNVSVSDTSTTSGSPQITSISLTWGDGASATFQALGFQTLHTYSAFGNYTINEVVSWTFAGSSYSANTSDSVSIPCTDCTNASTPFIFNLITGLFIIGFGSLAGLGIFVMKAPEYAITAIAVACAVGALVGYVVGGV